MILEWEDGTSGMPLTCSSMPIAQPSALSLLVLEARAGEHDLERDGHHCTCRNVFI